MEFDGVNDYVEIADNNLFSPYGNGTQDGELTVCAWFKEGRLTFPDQIVTKGAGSNYEWELRTDSTENKITFVSYDLSLRFIDTCMIFTSYFKDLLKTFEGAS
jgi:hypothetical protein